MVMVDLPLVPLKPNTLVKKIYFSKACEIQCELMAKETMMMKNEMMTMIFLEMDVAVIAYLKMDGPVMVVHPQQKIFDTLSLISQKLQWKKIIH